MDRRYKFPETPYAANKDYNPDLPSVIGKSFALKFDGTITAGAGGGVSGFFLDAPAGLVGTVELMKGNDAKLRMRMVDLYHLDALCNGRYGEKLQGAPTANNSLPFSINVEIPFGLNRLTENYALIDARRDKLITKGKFGSGVNDYATTNVANITAQLRPSVKKPSSLPDKIYLEPEFVQKDIKIDTSSDNIQDVIYLKESYLFMGLLLRQFDYSASGDAQRTDGILRQIIIEINGEEKIRARWGEVKQETMKFFSMPLAEMKTGIGFLPFVDDSNDMGYVVLEAGSRIEFTLNTSATVEEDITAVTPASGDLLIVTPIIYKIKSLPVSPIMARKSLWRR